MPDNISDDFADRVIGHALDLQRVKEESRGGVLTMLQRLEASLTGDLAASDPTRPARTAYQQARLEALLKQTKGTIETAYKDISKVNAGDLKELAGIESSYAMTLVNKTVGANVMSVVLSPQQLEALASNTLIDKAPSAAWWSRQGVALQNRFADQMREGMLRGETLEQLTRRVRGTKEKNYEDGVMDLSKRQAEALVRTSIQTVSNQAQLETYKANSDVVKGIQWVATLDKRTTITCRGLDGLQWDLDYNPIGHNKPFPGPTAHWGCRSTQISILKSWEELAKPGSIPAAGPGKKPTDIEKVFDKELEKQGFNEEQRAQIKERQKAKMDGEAAQGKSMDDYLKERPQAQQDAMLGKGKAELFRDGKITLGEMVDQKGRPLSLEELQDRVGAKKEGKIDPVSGLQKEGFVDMLYQKGGRTKAEILELTAQRFPGEDMGDLWKMVDGRPAKIRASGGEPFWKEAPAPKIDADLPKKPTPAKDIPPEPKKTPEAAPKEPPKLLTEERVKQADDVRKPEAKAEAATASRDAIAAWKPSAVKLFDDLPKPVKEMSPVIVSQSAEPRSLYRPWKREIVMGSGTKANTYGASQTFLRQMGHHVATMAKVVTSANVREDFAKVFATMAGKKAQDALGLSQSLQADAVKVSREQLGVDLLAASESDRRQIIDEFLAFHDIVFALTAGKYGSGHLAAYIKRTNKAEMETFAAGFAAVYLGNRFVESQYPELIAWTKEFLWQQ